MNEEILKELKTLNALMALVAIEINKQDGEPHVGHSLFSSKIEAAKALAEDIRTQIIED